MVFPAPEAPRQFSIQSRLNLPRRPERDGPVREEERDERRAGATGPLKAPPRTSGAPARAIRCVRDAEGAKGATAGVSPLAVWATPRGEI